MATIASLLADHVSLKVRSVDRIFLQGYVPRLMCEGLVCRFLLDRGYKIPSPALLGKIGRGFVAAIERYAEQRQIPVVRFVKGATKEEVARPFLEEAAAEGRFGVVMVGVAQERVSAWKGWREGGSDAHPHFEFGRQSAFVNHYYLYLRDREWGPAFIKYSSYAPWPCWIWTGGHEWAKRQAEQAGIGYVALDNGFRSCEDPDGLATICDRLGARDVEAFLRRWEAELPSPFTQADHERGVRYQLAFRQLELSDTRVFVRPQAGRSWFEQTIADQLALGRPDRIAIVFGRRVTRATPATPGRFSTEVISRGVEPTVQAHYKSSKVKQYLKEGRALRTETTVNDTRDFRIGRSVTPDNWQALTRIAHDVNERLLDAELAAGACAPSAQALEQIVLPGAPDDLRPAPASPQRADRAGAGQAALSDHRRGPADGRLPDQDLRPDPEPLARRAGPGAAARDHGSHPARTGLAGLRARPGGEDRRRRAHFVNAFRL